MTTSIYRNGILDSNFDTVTVPLLTPKLPVGFDTITEIKPSKDNTLETV